MTLNIFLTGFCLLFLLGFAHGDEPTPARQEFFCGEAVAVTSWVLPAVLKESSGIAFLKKTGWLYQIADSGNDPAVYRTDIAGQHLHKTMLEGVTNHDFEDLSQGECPKFLKNNLEKDCLFIADIGDNRRARAEIFLHVIDNHSLDLDMAKPLASVILNYPDEAHDAEAFAIHPVTQKGYLLSKEYDGLFFKSGRPSTLFMIDWEDVAPNKPYKLKVAGQLDIPGMAGGDHGLPTSMDFSEDGKWLYVLNYKNLLIINAEGWSTGSGHFPRSWVKGQNYFVVEIEEQKQMEAITVLNAGQFMVTSEKKKERAVTYSCRQKSPSRQSP